MKGAVRKVRPGEQYTDAIESAYQLGGLESVIRFIADLPLEDDELLLCPICWAETLPGYIKWPARSHGCPLCGGLRLYLLDLGISEFQLNPHHHGKVSRRECGLAVWSDTWTLRSVADLHTWCHLEELRLA